MDLNQYLTEVVLTGDNELNNFFDETLKKVFSPSYYNKIENTLDKIKLSYYNDPKDFTTAYVNKGNNKVIYINRYFFDKLPKDKKMEFLVHEFFHILQQTKSFIFIRKFKELIELEKKVEKIIAFYLTGSITAFLTGQSIETISPENEILSYMIGSRNVDWSKINPKGKKEIQTVLESSGLFNTSSDYWKKIF
jgi:hypothetical protein